LAGVTSAGEEGSDAEAQDTVVAPLDGSPGTGGVAPASDGGLPSGVPVDDDADPHACGHAGGGRTAQLRGDHGGSSLLYGPRQRPRRAGTGGAHTASPRRARGVEPWQ